MNTTISLNFSIKATFAPEQLRGAIYEIHACGLSPKPSYFSMETRPDWNKCGIEEPRQRPPRSRGDTAH